MRSVTAALGVLTAVLAAAMAILPGRVLFGPGATFPGPSLTVIRDGPEEGSAPPSPRDVPATPALAVPADTPSVRPIPTIRPNHAPSPQRAEDAQPGLEQIARIANILLNLPQVAR